MISKVLKANLILDVTDRLASDLVTAHPEDFPTTADVPEFLYKSLKTLWLGSGAASGDLAKAIVADPGIGNESNASIDILTDKMIPSYLFPRGMQSDEPGSFTTFCRIVLYKPRVTVSSTIAETINQTTLRLSYLLDHYNRSVRQLGELTVSGSPMVASEYLKCYLEEISGPGVTRVMSSSAMELVFRVEYKLQFLK